MREARSATEPAVRIGTAVTAVIALLPYVSDFFITAHFFGALAAVWFAVRKERKHISPTDGARLGFLSGFYGLLVASAIYDLIWEILNYQLWRVQNLDCIIEISAEAMRNALSPSIWFIITIQIIVAAICAGAFGAPSGILGAKIFRHRASGS